MKDILKELQGKAMQAADRASEEILNVYKSSREITVVQKEDDTPLTLADRNAHHVIVEILAETGLPLISEEGHIPDNQQRDQWEWYWLVDPLDGTREFLKRNDEFTVNIALMQHKTPVWGIIQAPVLHQTWYVGSGGKAYHKNLKTQKERIITARKKPARPVKVIVSRSHMNEETQGAIQAIEKKLGSLIRVTRGSSLKFCMLAEGKADFYPRMGPTMEWDTAAGHAIAVAAGCRVLQYPGMAPLEYNKEDLKNPFFIALPEHYPLPI